MYNMEDMIYLLRNIGSMFEFFIGLSAIKTLEHFIDITRGPVHGSVHEWGSVGSPQWGPIGQASRGGWAVGGWPAGPTPDWAVCWPQ